MPPPVRGHEVIDWYLDRDWCRLLRMIETTCPCRPVYYELCQEGGKFFIQRFMTDKSGTLQVHETAHEVHAFMIALWRRLLAGQAL